MKFDHDIEIKHQLPQKRTVVYCDCKPTYKVFYIQFPTILFVKITSHRFYPIGYIDNDYFSLQGVLPNIFGYGLCLDSFHERENIDKLISYFWESPFMPMSVWDARLKRLENNPHWFLNREIFPHKMYQFIDASDAYEAIEKYVLKKNLKNFPKKI